jgi:cytoskeletal protein RodZ
MAAETITFGEFLKQARERRGFTLERLAHETKIPQRHLEALERDNLGAIPAGFYQRAEIKAYARAVGLDQDVTLDRLRSASRQFVSNEPSRAAAARRARVFQRGYLLIALGVVVVVAIVLGRAATERASAPSAITPSAARPSAPPASIPRASTSPERVESPVAADPRAEAAPPDQQRTSSTTVTPALQQPAPLDSAPPPVAAQGVTATPEAQLVPLPAVPVTELVVTSDPPGARVTVNGIGWGTTPVTVRYLSAGEKRVRVSKEGYAAAEQVISVVQGQSRALEIPLAAAP